MLAPRPAAVLLTALLGAEARAQGTTREGFPIDVEILRPGLSPLGGFGVDAPQAITARTWSVGGLVQYENTPVRLFDGDDLLGAVVAHRTVVQLHAGVSASKRTSFSFMVPVAVNFGAGDVEGARNGAGLGDLAVTARFGVLDVGRGTRFHLGLLGTVLLPTGNRDQYMGERLPRLRAGALGYTDFGRVKLLTNLLFHVREPVDTGFDLTAGSELQIDLGLQGQVVPDRLDLIAELVSRVGLARGDDGGRLASEVVAGVRYHATDHLRIDAGVGRGLTEGYGTTGVRALVGLTWVHVPKPKPEPAPVVVVVEEEPEVIDAPDPPPPEEPPAPPPQAVLTGEEIVFRDPIEFVVGTTTLLPESGPVLDAVAAVILEHPEIGHVVIEGHASEEGEYDYNYKLSDDRARVIYEALILRGVHPKRLSYRGAGEVEPVAEGSSEDALARNRRVVFRVIRQYLPGEPRPGLGDTVQLPWSGEPHKVQPTVEVVPPPPPTPAPAPQEEE